MEAGSSDPPLVGPASLSGVRTGRPGRLVLLEGIHGQHQRGNGLGASDLGADRAHRVRDRYLMGAHVEILLNLGVAFIAVEHYRSDHLQRHPFDADIQDKLVQNGIYPDHGMTTA
jgi:hypothetical protein